MNLARPRRRLALVFLGSLIALGYFLRPRPNPNENSRMAPVLALYWHGTLAIDAYHRAGPMSTTDESFHGGHFYSDKAPGSSLLAAIGYAPLYAWERASGREAPYPIRKWAMTLAADGVPVAAALCALFALAGAIAGPRAAAAVTLAGLVATPLLPFGSAFFGHAVAGALLFLAFALVRRLSRTAERGEAAAPRARATWGELVGAGALLGMAVATEYTTAPAALLVAAYGLFRLGRLGQLRRARTWLGPLLGALPFAALVLVYNRACFGSPFSLGYENLASPFYRQFHAHGMVGVGQPHLDVLYYLTLHPARGIFVTAPVLLLSLPGLWRMARRPGWRAEAALCAGVFLTFLLVNAGFGLWWGGYTYTARHLIPGIPFLLLPLAFLPRSWAWVAVPLFAVSAAETLMAAFGNPFSNDGFLYDQLRALQGRGLVAWRGSSTVAREVWPALRARSASGAWTGFAINLGRLFGLTGPASALPLGLALALLFGAASHPLLGRELAPRRARAGSLGARERRETA